MARARKCDRCKTLYEPSSIEVLKRNKANALMLIDRDMDNKYFARETIDLCPACLGELSKWLTMEADE